MTQVKTPEKGTIPVTVYSYKNYPSVVPSPGLMTGSERSLRYHDFKDLTSCPQILDLGPFLKIDLV